jgi:integrase
MINQPITVIVLQNVVQKSRKTQQSQKVVANILPDLAVVVRQWELASGKVGQSYRARIYYKGKRKYVYFTLESSSERKAVTEALDLYRSKLNALDKGLPIGRDAKKLEHYISMFMNYMEIRYKNGKITKHRVAVVRQLLKSLEKFAAEKNNPLITDLPQIYEDKFEEWRDKSLTRLTARPLTATSRNNEVNAHKQFFGFLRDREIVGKVPLMNLQKVVSDVIPFPAEKYNALMAHVRKEIESCKNPKTQWNWMTMRHIIMLMYGTGCRVSEIRNLKWTDIYQDGKEKRIHLQGKNKERDIVISDRIWGTLQDLRAYRSIKGKGWGWNEVDYPFVFSSWKLVELKAQFDSRGRREWYQAIGLDPHRYQLGCFRHRFISSALKQGVPALQIAFYCGTSVAMIQRTYGKFTPKNLFDQVFINAPEESLAGKGRSQWMERLIDQ